MKRLLEYSELQARANDLFSNITGSSQNASSAKRKSRSLSTQNKILKSDSRFTSDRNSCRHPIGCSQDLAFSSQTHYRSQSSFSSSQKWIDLPVKLSQAAASQELVCFADQLFPNCTEKPLARVMPQRSLADTPPSSFAEVSETLLLHHSERPQSSFPNYSFNTTTDNSFNDNNQNVSYLSDN